jgi:hypothetical protein
MQPYTTIMHLDCFDNYLAIPAEKILERMAEFDTDLLITGEENCWPDPTQVKRIRILPVDVSEPSHQPPRRNLTM